MAIEFDIKESLLFKDVYIITPNKFRDLRGEIWTAFTSEAIDKLLPDGLKFIHDKFIHSKHNVIRGIHGDIKTYKLATCVYGEVHQVVVDCRKDSPTYLKYEKFIINEDNQQIILVPAGFGNGHYVSSQSAVYYYKCAYLGEYVDAKDQFTYAWNDERIKIDWPTKSPILSQRDSLATKDKG
ncbi:dTDP-4-dehydrorhamnose 3,5-epimerase family protein [Campylobacter sp. VicNov18]|uniref:dTDP-4-dehydrorhamnose 3,5-epimerase family protein n=1 Tax=Campylobacter bilis TaxID=2691918 RepID=UPI00130DD85E|nr:dTDP-4-dehydrorhamnose 3,5-epimerase family protein [Campylobacter bilis]MPV64165.1 dTDP-4-dehydrorhamnose 3,5-epimerase [Campylobacter hepaticus]MBM0637669.1 dTDP-4-dehydrorhamnose 3,5-epimerase [Campylobacter bilis]MCC8278393.1 dTDP-4-dehydrorhamnose 3,5-epimerase family protein [Campylobacter bilis]MCC8299897.1 dTDP-4-dehydrorhamnose 3,5-epimerase family protein [Campylobacter bilis]MCC8301302.1 dTDP-4-dehydrorhamnose 3,5-epimerase family protein [Campylobacter bilis]